MAKKIIVVESQFYGRDRDYVGEDHKYLPGDKYTLTVQPSTYIRDVVANKTISEDTATLFGIKIPDPIKIEVEITEVTSKYVNFAETQGKPVTRTVYELEYTCKEYK